MGSTTERYKWFFKRLQSRCVFYVINLLIFLGTSQMLHWSVYSHLATENFKMNQQEVHRAIQDLCPQYGQWVQGGKPSFTV